jgi:hypothetical protein
MNCVQDKSDVYHLAIPCTTVLNVNTQTGVDVVDAYVCKNTKVTWNANGHTFTVFFKHACPFTSGCKKIDDQHPTAGPISSGTFTVYEYGIMVDDTPFDPHIIGGGQ